MIDNSGQSNETDKSRIKNSGDRFGFQGLESSRGFLIWTIETIFSINLESI